MISIENLSVEFGVEPLFTDVNYVINRHDRIAIVGKNGAGKSTMLKIIAGIQNPTNGRIGKPKDLTIGYLPQVMNLTDSLTVKEETEKAFSNTIKLEEHLAHLNQELAERTDYDSDSYHELIEEMTDLNEQLTVINGQNRNAEIERTLIGLGFKHNDFERPTAEFSGGWRMRIELAKILLQRPEVLLLDEPTNHLDIESIQWLEHFLTTNKSTLLLISHDRAFLDNVTNRTIEITCGTIHDYNVNYSKYVTLHAERIEQQKRAYENQQKMIQETKDFIERFRYQATKAVQVQSRIKQLEKIVPIVVDEVDNSHLNLKFPAAPRSGDYPVICNGVKKVYDRVIFDNVDLTIKRGEKVAFVGRNGEGKSTLVKCIMGQIPFEGELKVGHGVKIGYFAQNQAQLLDEKISVFDTIDRVAVGDVRTRIKDILGAFMFSGESIEKPVKVLSGGERSRLAMIKLLLEPTNLLILDEPTNHLDMASKDVLKKAIQAFDGTVILVSHDRAFLDGLVSKVYVFGNGGVREHLGGIYDYLKSLAQQEPMPKETEVKDKRYVQKPESLPVSDNKGLSFEEQKAQKQQRNKLEKLVKQAEQDISRIEKEIAKVEEKLSTIQGSQDQKLYIQHSELKKQLDEVTELWMTTSEELDSL